MEVKSTIHGRGWISSINLRCSRSYDILLLSIWNTSCSLWLTT